MPEKKLDLSALESLNIPEYKPETQVQEFALSSEEAEKIKNEAVEEIETVASLESFEKKITKPRVENTEETEEVEEEVEEEATPVEGATEDSPIKVLAEWAGSKGIIEFDAEKFEDSEDYLENKLNEVVNKGVESWKNELPEEITNLITNYQEGVPLDELIYSRSREIEYKAIKEDLVEDDEVLQERLVSEWIVNTDPDATEDEIKKEIKGYKDSLLLPDKAKTALKKLQKFEEKYQEGLIQEARIKKDKAEKAFLESLKSIEKTINDSEEIIPGSKLTKEQKKMLFEGYTKANSKNQTLLTKMIQEDPKAHLKIAEFFLIHKGNLDSVKTKLKTEVVKETKKSIQTYGDTSPLNKLNISKLKKGMEAIKASRQSI